MKNYEDGFYDGQYGTEPTEPNNSNYMEGYYHANDGTYHNMDPGFSVDVFLIKTVLFVFLFPMLYAVYGTFKCIIGVSEENELIRTGIIQKAKTKRNELRKYANKTMLAGGGMLLTAMIFTAVEDESETSFSTFFLIGGFLAIIVGIGFRMYVSHIEDQLKQKNNVSDQNTSH